MLIIKAKKLIHTILTLLYNRTQDKERLSEGGLKHGMKEHAKVTRTLGEQSSEAISMSEHTSPVDPSSFFYTPRRKPLADITASDVPRGIDPDLVATDYPEE